MEVQSIEDEYMEAPMKKVQSAGITFSTEDIFSSWRGRSIHKWPLYLTGHIGERKKEGYHGQTKVSIPGQRAISKIRLKYQRWDLKTEVGFYLPPDCLSRLPYSLRDLIASYPFLAFSFSTFASSALNEQSDAGLPVDCGVLVLVDFAYLFLVLGQAALAQVESVAVGIK
ncbi:hypothetical protein V6N11_079893 [Hibiscus sabdariffa]|uniref:Uncharacterized protein n=1 Tax=Hibiscus sabdariffa TaxID=183260 RepID=A0ABR2RX23_9ROSI